MKTVNYIRHLNAVFEEFSRDSRLNPTHISLYMALFQLWNHYQFTEEFYINREEVMKLSRIGSKGTYHRCIRQLDQWNYIIYKPSHNPFQGSKIKMFVFETTIEQASNLYAVNFRTGSKQVLVSKDKGKQKIQNSINRKEQSREAYRKSAHQLPEPCEPEAFTFQDNLKIIAVKNYNEPL